MKLYCLHVYILILLSEFNIWGGHFIHCHLGWFYFCLQIKETKAVTALLLVPESGLKETKDHSAFWLMNSLINVCLYFLIQALLPALRGSTLTGTAKGRAGSGCAQICWSGQNSSETFLIPALEVLGQLGFGSFHRTCDWSHSIGQLNLDFKNVSQSVQPGVYFSEDGKHILLDS